MNRPCSTKSVEEEYYILLVGRPEGKRPSQDIYGGVLGEI
jgi:hypothetical protein